MIGAVPSFLSAQQAEQIRAEVRVRESALDFDAIDYVNDRMELDRELAREAWGGRFRASLVVCAFIVIGVVLYAGHVWGGV